MIIIDKRKLLLILGFSFVLILAVSIWTYKTGMQFHLKTQSERLLFFGFIAAGIQLVLSILLLRSGKKTNSDFSMLMEAIKLNGTISETRARRLDNLGLELQAALESAHKITEQKTKKIVSLNSLLTMLTGMIEHPLIVAALNGEILEASPKAQSQFSCKKGDMLSHIFPQTDIREAYKESSVTHAPVEQEGHIVFVPVFSGADEISYFLVDMSHQDLLSKFADAVKNMIKEEPAAAAQTKKTGLGLGAFDKIKKQISRFGKQ